MYCNELRTSETPMHKLTKPRNFYFGTDRDYCNIPVRLGIIVSLFPICHLVQITCASSVDFLDHTIN